MQRKTMRALALTLGAGAAVWACDPGEVMVDAGEMLIDAGEHVGDAQAATDAAADASDAAETFDASEADSGSDAPSGQFVETVSCTESVVQQVTTNHLTLGPLIREVTHWYGVLESDEIRSDSAVLAHACDFEAFSAEDEADPGNWTPRNLGEGPGRECRPEEGCEGPSQLGPLPCGPMDVTWEAGRARVDCGQSSRGDSTTVDGDGVRFTAGGSRRVSVTFTVTRPE